MACILSAIFLMPLRFHARGVLLPAPLGQGVNLLPGHGRHLLRSAARSGQLVGRLGYYTPFSMLSSVLMPVGAGLLSTFRVDTCAGSLLS
ncbi:hypothetical protein LX36DRAFT_713725 [Colletotrichum falcatum]|nr:hypothetical protein LX36DRAFT_713725 [Colletotrichum falcatum]